MCGHGGRSHADLLGADGRADVLAIQIDMLFALDKSKLEGDIGQQRIDCLVVLRFFARAEGIKADGTEHRTGVHINVAEVRSQTPRQRRFACARRPVDRNRNHFYISFSMNLKFPAA